ncbi:MAG: hypothetical protein HC801_03275 [Nitrospira sp.]|nr:hypothetical protein [Nitrospira sp.]
MAEVNVSNQRAEDSHILDEASLPVLQAQQQAWTVFAKRAMHMIPALKAQMKSVTQETERAVLDLMVPLRLLASSDRMISPKERAESLSKVVMALQFQDITRQKLEHVGLAMEQLRSHMQILLNGPLNEEAQQTIAELEAIEQHYTMEEERRLHQNALRPDYGEPVPTGLSDEGEDSVTLF